MSKSKLQELLERSQALREKKEKQKAKEVMKVAEKKYPKTDNYQPNTAETSSRVAKILAKRGTIHEEIFFDPDNLLQQMAETKAILDQENLAIAEKVKARAKLRKLTNLQIDPSKLSASEIQSLRDTIPELFKKLETNNAIPESTRSVDLPDISSASTNNIHTSAKTGTEVQQEVRTDLPKSDGNTRLQKHEITYDRLNDEQREAVDYAKRGESFCLIGGAGSGKTTTQRIVLEETVFSVSNFNDTYGHKYLSMNAPAVAIVSFTNKAVENIRSAAPDSFKNSCMTMHKLLQYGPTYEMKETYDEFGNETVKEVLVFRPAFNSDNKLPHIDMIIVEEASNISEELYQQVIDALPAPSETRWIFLGDLNQLPPVVGNPVLATKMLELPVVALEKVYRQDSDSAIKKLAMDILAGKPLPDDHIKALKVKDQFEPHIFAKRVKSKILLPTIANTLRKFIETGKFIAGEDIILTPNNEKGCEINMVNVNLEIAEIYRQIHQLEIWEVQAGYRKLYLAHGDIVLFRKQYYKIERIVPNYTYTGIPTRAPTTNMDRWGAVVDRNASGGDDISIEEMFAANMGNIATKEVTEDSGEKVNKLSHVISLVPLEQQEYFREVDVDNVGDLKDFQFGYALTVHKSQGSEWRNVVMILHHEASRMARRELLYTGVTRARDCLYLWFDGEKRGDWNSSWLQKGIINQEIPGRTIKDKLEYFQKKQDSKDAAAEWKKKLRERTVRDADKELYGEN